MPAPNALVIALRDTFANSFSLDEMTDFALELGIDLQDIEGDNRKAKARELATYISRHDLMNQLATVGPDARPDVDWAALLEPYGYRPQRPAEYQKLSVSAADLQTLQPILAERPMFMTPDGRAATLSLAGVGNLVAVDMNGNNLLVAGLVLDQLNRYGEIAPGDTALVRLLTYLQQDPSLPPKNLEIIKEIMDRNGLLKDSP